MYDHVLLPTDGSEGIEAAATHAAAIAERFDATVHVLSIVDTRNRFETPSGGLSTDAWLEAERERSAHAIAETVAMLPETLDIERVRREGVPKSAIVDYAEEAPIDLVVMGTHGRTGLDHYLVGSVAESVVRHSPVPVVTVRLDED